jgi:hypothetical protein
MEPGRAEIWPTLNPKLYDDMPSSYFASTALNGFPLKYSLPSDAFRLALVAPSLGHEQLQNCRFRIMFHSLS